MDAIIDTFFTIGRHKICEDYAIHNDNKIVICDGCSSAERTDFGSRLLAQIALDSKWHSNSEINYQEDLNYLNLIAFKTYVIANNLNLPLDCLHATLLIAEKKENTIDILMVGDGCIAFRNRNTKEITINHFEYEKNAPYYLRYEMDSLIHGLPNKMKENYFNQCGKFKSIQKTLGSEETNESLIEIDKKFPFHRFKISLDEVDFVALMSDGVESFKETEITETSVSQKDVSLDEILKEILSFKRFSTNFVQRRMNKAFKEFNKKSWINQDDVSIGVIAT